MRQDLHVSQLGCRQSSCGFLIADPAISSSSPLVEMLVDDGFDIRLAQSVQDVHRHLREHFFSYVITELVFSDGTGAEVVGHVLSANSSCRAIVHSKFCTLAKTVEVVKAGADDVFPKPTPLPMLLSRLLYPGRSGIEVIRGIPSPDAIRRHYIRETIEGCEACTSRAARELSMHRRTLTRILERMPSSPEGGPYRSWM